MMGHLNSFLASGVGNLNKNFPKFSKIKSACVNVFFGLVQNISRLDSQSKFQMFTLFTVQHDSSILNCTILFRTLANISTLGQHTYLKRVKQSSLFMVYNFTIS